MTTDMNNPYKAPSHIPVLDSRAVDPTVTKNDRPISFAERIVSTVAVIAFFAFGYFAIRLFLNGDVILSLLTATMSLMCIPMVEHTYSLRQRLACSSIMPFAMAGAACFVLLYFWMFRFVWFENIFNDKGSGPLGLMLAVVSGLMVGGLFGWLVVRTAFGNVFAAHDSTYSGKPDGAEDTAEQSDAPKSRLVRVSKMEDR